MGASPRLFRPTYAGANVGHPSATDTGGVREAVEDEVNGFLVPRSDASRLAERSALLITSADLRQTMGLQSRRRFSQHFEWRSMLDKTVAIYAAALPDVVTSGVTSPTLTQLNPEG